MNWEKIIECYKDKSRKSTIHEFCRENHVTLNELYRQLKARGVMTNYPKKPGNRQTTDEIIIDEYRKRHSISEVALKLGIPKDKIKTVLTNYFTQRNNRVEVIIPSSYKLGPIPLYDVNEVIKEDNRNYFNYENSN